jgi:Ca2+-binding RTX toxin-like protein
MPKQTIVNGTAGNDVLSSTTGNEVLNALGGNDRLYGGAGTNDLIGGDGNDRYFIDADIDIGVNRISELVLTTNPFNPTPTWSPSNGIDTLDFGATTTKAINISLSTTAVQTVATGVNIVIPVVAIENAYGGALNDTIIGNYLDNILSGGTGNDTLDGGTGNDTLYGGTGNDTLYGGTGLNILYGEGDDDTLYGGDGEIVQNGGGNGTGMNPGMFSRLGNTLDGGTGNDTLYGGLGNDTLYGGLGNDTLYGGDTPFGDIPGSDRLYGGDGDDYLYTGDRSGNYFYGRYTDYLTGGTGNDSFFLKANVGQVIITDFTTGQDKIVLRKSKFTQLTSAVGGSIGSNFEIIANDNVVLTSTSSAAILYSASTGNMFYNTDGAIAGLGSSGGSFAVLSGNPVLTDNDFSIVA